MGVVASPSSCQEEWSSAGATAAIVSKSQRIMCGTHLCLFLQVECVDLLQFTLLCMMSGTTLLIMSETTYHPEEEGGFVCL